MDDALLDRASALAARGERRLLGIAGPPGAGKSTLARELVVALGDSARLVPMDGFHLAGSEVSRLGLVDRKGAIDTFDITGYVHLLERLKTAAVEAVYAPEFRREIEEPIAAALSVPAEVPLVVTEGNYLLVDDGAWASVRPLLDEAWYVAIDEAVRRERLTRRHIAHGREPQAARDWVRDVDDVNAAVVRATRSRADLVVEL